MNNRINPFLLILTLLLTTQFILAQSSYSPNRFLIVFEEDATQDDIDEALEDLNCTEIWVSPISATRLWEVIDFPFVYPPTNTTIYNINEESSTARSRAKVQEAGLDYETDGIYDNPDSGIPGNSGPDLQMDCYGQISSYTNTSTHSVDLGIFDTGFTYPIPSIINEYYFNIYDYSEYDYLEDDTVAEDFHGHGTHISSCVAHIANKDAGIKGMVPPDLHFKMSKTFDNSGIGYIAEIIYAFEESVLDGMQIANFSWSFKESSTEALRSPLRHSLESTLNDYELLIVCAAGNDGEDIDDPINLPNWPAAYTFNNLLTVGTYDCTDNVAEFSNYGEKSVDIVAPGYKIPGLTPEGLEHKTGTSQSTAIVTGLAASLATHQIEFNANEIKCAIVNSATGTNELETKLVSGGYLNAESALSILGYCNIEEIRSNSYSSSEMSLYPNPSNENFIQIRFEHDSNEEVHLSIYDQLGQHTITKQFKVFTGENTLKYDLEHLSNGIYTIHVFSQNKRMVGQFMRL